MASLVVVLILVCGSRAQAQEKITLSKGCYTYEPSPVEGPENVLIDGKKGSSAEVHVARWKTFEPVEIVFDLGKNYPIDRVKLYSSSSRDGKIGVVTLYASQDGQTYTEIGKADNSKTPLTYPKTEIIEVKANGKEARFVKIKYVASGGRITQLSEVEIFQGEVIPAEPAKGSPPAAKLSAAVQTISGQKIPLKPGCYKIISRHIAAKTGSIEADEEAKLLVDGVKGSSNQCHVVRFKRDTSSPDEIVIELPGFYNLTGVKIHSANCKDGQIGQIKVRSIADGICSDTIGGTDNSSAPFTYPQPCEITIPTKPTLSRHVLLEMREAKGKGRIIQISEVELFGEKVREISEEAEQEERMAKIAKRFQSLFNTDPKTDLIPESLVSKTSQNMSIAFLGNPKTDKSLEEIYRKKGMKCFCSQAFQTLRCSSFGCYMKEIGLKELASDSANALAEKYLMIVVPWIPDWNNTDAKKLKQNLKGYVQRGRVLYIDGPVGTDPQMLNLLGVKHEGNMGELAGVKGKDWSCKIDIADRALAKEVFYFYPEICPLFKTGNPLYGRRRPAEFSYSKAWIQAGKRPYIPVSSLEPRLLSLFETYSCNQDKSLEKISYWKMSLQNSTTLQEKSLHDGTIINSPTGGGVTVYRPLPYLDLIGQLAMSTENSKHQGLTCTVLTSNLELYNDVFSYVLQKTGVILPFRYYLPNAIRWTCFPHFDTTCFPDKGDGEIYDDRITLLAQINDRYDLQGVFLEGYDGCSKPIGENWKILNEYHQLSGFYFPYLKLNTSQKVRNTIKDIDTKSGQKLCMIRDSGRNHGWWGRDMLQRPEDALPDKYFVWPCWYYNSFSCATPVPFFSTPGDIPHTYTIYGYTPSRDGAIQQGGSKLGRLNSQVDSHYQHHLVYSPHLHPAFSTYAQFALNYPRFLDMIVAKPEFQPVNFNTFFNYNRICRESCVVTVDVLGPTIFRLQVKNEGNDPISGLTFSTRYGRIKSVKNDDGTYNLFVNANNVSLPCILPGEQILQTIEVAKDSDKNLPLFGIYGSDAKVAKAIYNPDSGKIEFSLCGEGDIFVALSHLPYKNYRLRINGKVTTGQTSSGDKTGYIGSWKDGDIKLLLFQDIGKELTNCLVEPSS